jgi:hypothetical protein
MISLKFAKMINSKKLEPKGKILGMLSQIKHLRRDDDELEKIH